MEQIIAANTFSPCPLWEAVLRLSAAHYTDTATDSPDPNFDDK